MLIFSTSHVLLLLLLSRFSRVQLCATPQAAAHQAPQDSPGKNTGVGCHFLQCVKVKSESEVTLSCPTCSNPMDCSLPGSSVHGIFQARVLEWGAIAFSSHVLGAAKVYVENSAVTTVSVIAIIIIGFTALQNWDSGWQRNQKFRKILSLHSYLLKKKKSTLKNIHLFCQSSGQKRDTTSLSTE